MAYEHRVVFLPVIVGLTELDEQSADAHRGSDFSAQFQKTRMCRFYPRCRRGASCPFAHGQEELKPCPNFTKTRMCAGWADGRCKLDPSQCKFAHGPQELRNKDDAGTVAQVNTCPTTASLATTTSNRSSATTSNRSTASSASSRTASRESTGQTKGGPGIQPVLSHWITGIQEACRGSVGQPIGSMPSPEECRAVLLNAMPEQYED